MSCYRAGNGAMVHSFEPTTQDRNGPHEWVCDCGRMAIPRAQMQVNDVSPELVRTSVILLALVALGLLAWAVAWAWP